MFKKMLLSTLLAISTIASAHINLDLDLTISHNGAERNTTGSITIEENIVTSIGFNDLESLVIDVIAQSGEEMVTIQAQFFQQMENDELVPVTEPLAVQVPYNQPGIITVNEADDSGSLTLVIIPSLVE